MLETGRAQLDRSFRHLKIGVTETIYHSSGMLSNLSSTWTSKPPLVVKYRLEPTSLDQPGGPKSLCSTLERLLAWEKNLYEEVKVREKVLCHVTSEVLIIFYIRWESVLDIWYWGKGFPTDDHLESTCSSPLWLLSITLQRSIKFKITSKGIRHELEDKSSGNMMMIVNNECRDGVNPSGKSSTVKYSKSGNSNKRKPGVILECQREKKQVVEDANALILHCNSENEGGFGKDTFRELGK